MEKETWDKTEPLDKKLTQALSQIDELFENVDEIDEKVESFLSKAGWGLSVLDAGNALIEDMTPIAKGDV